MWSLVMSRIARFRRHTASLHQAMRSTGYHMLRCDWLVFISCDWCISILAVSVCCSFGGPLSYGFAVFVFLDRGHPCFRNFYSTIPIDVVRVKSYVNRLFDLKRRFTTMNNSNLFYDINESFIELRMWKSNDAMILAVMNAILAIAKRSLKNSGLRRGLSPWPRDTGATL